MNPQSKRRLGETSRAGVHRRGFGLVELVVVLVILGLLFLVVITWLGRQNSMSRVRRCQESLRMIGMAILSFEETENRYPGYVDSVASADGGRYARPLIYMISPYVDRGDFQSVFKKYSAAKDPHDGVKGEFISALVCPDDRQKMTSGQPANSYVFNTGLPDDPAASPPDWPANGVIQNLYPARVRGAASARAALIEGAPAAAFVQDHDGLSDTLMVSENVQAGWWTSLEEWEIGFVWSPKFAKNPLARINSQVPEGFAGDKYLLARPSSYHAGVVNAAFCDAHAKVLNQQIDYRVLSQLMTSWGKEAAWPGLQDGKKRYIDNHQH